MSRFLTTTFVETRPPPSLQTCAAARSNANPLAPRTPASAHAARWWPRQSRRRPHRQVREKKGSGKWRRRHNKTRNGCGSIHVDRDVGKAMNALHASGPFCDRGKEEACLKAPSLRTLGQEEAFFFGEGEEARKERTITTHGVRHTTTPRLRGRCACPLVEQANKAVQHWIK